MSGVSTGSSPARAAPRRPPRNQIVRDVVQDLLLEALLDDAGRHLAGAEAGNARLARVVARDAVRFRRRPLAGDFDAQVLAGLVDVDEFGFHGCVERLSCHEIVIMLRCRGRVDDMRSAVISNVEPEIVRCRNLKGQRIVVAAAPAHDNLAAVHDNTAKTPRRILFGFRCGRGMVFFRLNSTGDGKPGVPIPDRNQSAGLILNGGQFVLNFSKLTSHHISASQAF